MAKNTAKKGMHKAHFVTDTSPQLGRFVSKNDPSGTIHKATMKSKGVVVETSIMTGREPLGVAEAPEDQARLYASRIAAGVHESMAELYDLGIIDKTTMDTFDESCLTPVAELAAPDIKALRERERVSQSVLAKYLGVATATLGQWERGLRKPDGPVLKLLSLVDRHGLEYIR